MKMRRSPVWIVCGSRAQCLGAEHSGQLISVCAHFACKWC